MFTVALVVVVVSIFLALYVRRIGAWLVERKRIAEFGEKFTGPKPVPILGNALQLPQNLHDHLQWMIDQSNAASAKGEGAYRIWIGSNLYVMPVDGPTVKDIVDSNVQITKSSDYDFIVPWLGTGLLTSTDEKWRSRRKMLTPTFHFAMLDSYLEIFNHQSQILIKHLEKFVDAGEIEIFQYVKRCALDIICEAAMGKTLNAQNEQDNPYVISVREMSDLLVIYNTQPWNQFLPVFYALGYGSRRDKALKILTDFTKTVIAERKEARKSGGKLVGKSGRTAFLDMLLDLGDEGKLTDSDIRDEVDTFMFEGHDTTSSGIGFALWALACHPEIQEKVAAELEAIFGDSDRPITHEDLKEMKYLEMCLKEALRMFPPVPMIQRAILREDLRFGDKILPRGCTCAISPLAMHYNPKIYPNPRKYDPERFLPENIAKRHPYDYIPFSAGPRNCIGQKFAQNEEKTMVASILRKFKLEATIPFEKNRPGIGATLIPEFGFPVKISRRSQN